MSEEFSSSTIKIDYDELIKDTNTLINQLNTKLNLQCSIEKVIFGSRIGVFGDPKFDEKKSIENNKLRYIDWTSYQYYRFRIRPKIGLVHEEF